MAAASGQITTTKPPEKNLKAGLWCCGKYPGWEVRGSHLVTYYLRGEEIADKKIVRQELEDSIRAVLGNLDNLQPFITDHFIIFPYKSKWERVSHLRFKHGAALLEPYPFVCTLYVEMKWAPAGTPGGDNDLPEMVGVKGSPLHRFSQPALPSAGCPSALGQGESQGSGSCLKGDDEEAEVKAMAAKRRRLEGCKFPTGQEQGRALMGTSSRKKTLTHTRRNWPGEAASEDEETEDFDIAFLKDHGKSQEILSFG